MGSQTFTTNWKASFPKGSNDFDLFLLYFLCLYHDVSTYRNLGVPQNINIIRHYASTALLYITLHITNANTTGKLALEYKNMPKVLCAPKMLFIEVEDLDKYILVILELVWISWMTETIEG